MPVMDTGYPASGMMDPIITKIVSDSATITSMDGGGGVRSIEMLAKVAEACIREEEMITNTNTTTTSLETVSSSTQNTTMTGSSDILKFQPSSTVVASVVGSVTTPHPLITTTTTTTKLYTLKQIRKLTEKRLLSIFTERLQKTKNKNKILSYKCQINPQSCQMKIECFSPVDEPEVRRQVANHLMFHVAEFESTMPDVKLQSMKRIKPRKPKNPVAIAAPVVSVQSSCKTEPPCDVEELLVQTQPIDLTSKHQTTSTTTAASMLPPLLQQTGQNKPQLVSQIKLENSNESNSTIVVAQDMSKPKTIIASKSNSIASTPQDLEKQTTTGVSINQRIVNLPQVSLPTSVIAAVGDVAPANISPPPNADAKITITMLPTVAAAQKEKSSATTFLLDSHPTSEQAQLDQKLALDYIDDIRKKSSSAAKAVIINGDRALIYQCKLCPDKQFTSTNGLIFHYKKHAGLKPYVCEICANTFTRQHSLNYHMLIHNNKSRFRCDECGRHFRHPSHFKEHMRRHTGETPFQCGDCLIKFKTRNTYKRHLHTKHSKILTSKGIIERASAPYQNSAKPSLSNAASVMANTDVGSAVHGKNGTLMPSTIVANNPVKPRRNYKIDKLRDNIERRNKYEEQQAQHQQQQQQQAAVAAAIGQVMDLSSQSNATHSVVSNATTGVHESSVLTGMSHQAYPAVAIYNLQPSMPGMNTVHILDANAAARIGKPFVDLTEPMYNQAQPILSATVPSSHPAMAVVSIQPSAMMTDEAMHAAVHGGSGNDHVSSLHHHHPHHQQQQHITELKTSNMLLAGPTQSVGATIPVGTLVNHSVEHHHQHHHHHPQQFVVEQQQHQQNISTTATSQALAAAAAASTTAVQACSSQHHQQLQQQQPPSNNNENFMRLLEAIALTES